MITDYAVGFLTIDPYMTMSESVCSNPGGSSAIEADVTGRNRASEQSDLSRRRFVSFRRRKDLNDSAINTRHTARRNLPPLPPLDSESLSFAVADTPPATVAGDVISGGTGVRRPPDAIRRRRATVVTRRLATAKSDSGRRVDNQQQPWTARRRGCGGVYFCRCRGNFVCADVTEDTYSTAIDLQPERPPTTSDVEHERLELQKGGEVNRLNSAAIETVSRIAPDDLLAWGSRGSPHRIHPIMYVSMQSNPSSVVFVVATVLTSVVQMTHARLKHCCAASEVRCHVDDDRLSSTFACILCHFHATVTSAQQSAK